MQSASYSYSHRHLFLTGCNDGSVRLYHALKQEPILSFEPTTSSITCVAWTPFRPCLFACSTADGVIFLYDLVVILKLIKKSKFEPSHVIKADGIPIVKLAFSKSNQLVAGDASGCAVVWRLDRDMTTQTSRDELCIQELGQI